MKKLMALTLAVIMVLSLVACGGNNSSKNNSSSSSSSSSSSTSTPSTSAPSTPAEGEKLKVEKGSNKSASGETDKDVYIDMWGTYADDNARALWLEEMGAAFAAEFEAEYGVSVQVDYFSQNDYGGCATKLAAGVAGGDLPVLCQISSQQCPAFEALCDDMTKYMSAEAIDNYQDGLLVGCVKDGKVFAAPGGRSVVCAVVNMDLVEKAGYTKADIDNWNWDKFHEICLAISALGDDIYGTGLWWDTDAWMFESALYSNGGSIDNEECTKITFAENGDGAQYLDLVAEMMDDGSMYSGFDNYTASEISNVLNTMLAEGKLGCRMASITNYSSVKKLVSEAGTGINIYMAPQPAGDGGFSNVTGGNNFLFLKQATETQKFVAAKYLEYIARPENDLAWFELSSYMPVSERTYETDAYAALLAEDPNYGQIAVCASYAHARPKTLVWAEMRKYLMDGLVAWSQDYASYKAANGGSTQAVVEMWAAHCQKILDENK